MMVQSAVFSIILSLLASSEAFSVVGPSKSVACTHRRQQQHCSTTLLGAEADDAAAAEGEEKVEELTNESAAAPDTAATDILNSPDFLKRKLEVLKSDLEKAKTDLASAKAAVESGKAEWGPQLDSLQKEFKNIQQRMNSQSSQSDDMATTQVVRQMLDFLDTFDRAFGQVTPETDEQEAIQAKYKKVYDEILAAFGNLGVEEVATLGTEFDYEVHQAVMQRPTDEYEEGIVCEELAKGFKIGETLIRAAMVVVAA